MIFASLNGFENRPGLGALAAATLVQGTHFNCNASICYGIGASNHQALKDLQTAVNRYVSMLGAKPLVVDGFIGSATVALCGRAASAANFTAPATKEALAASAPSVTQRLNAFLDTPTTLPTPTKPPSVATVTTAPSAPSTTTTQPRPGTVTTPTALPQTPVVPTPFRPDTVSTAPATALIPLAPKKASVPIWVWVTAGVAGVIVVGLVGYALRKPEPVALANWRSYSRRPRGLRYYREW